MKQLTIEQMQRKALNLRKSGEWERYCSGTPSKRLVKYHPGDVVKVVGSSWNSTEANKKRTFVYVGSYVMQGGGGYVLVASTGTVSGSFYNIRKIEEVGS